MKEPLRVRGWLGLLLLAIAVPASWAQSEVGGPVNTCYNDAIPTSSILVNYTRSETAAATTFSFLVQPEGSLATTVSGLALRISSQLAAMPTSITKSVPTGQIQGQPPQFVWTETPSQAETYSLALSASMTRPFYLTSLCQQGITVLDASGKPAFQQPSAPEGQPGSCILFFRMTDGSCGYQLLSDLDLPPATAPPTPPSPPAVAPATPPAKAGYGSYSGTPSGSYGYGSSPAPAAPSPPASPPPQSPVAATPLFGPPVALSPKAPPAAYGPPPSPAAYGGSPSYGSPPSYSSPPSPSPGYGSYAGSRPSYGSYGSPPAAGYYSVRAATPAPTTLFGNGRSLLEVTPDPSIISAGFGLNHFGSAFPSNAWQFLHHKGPSGGPRFQGCPEPTGTAEMACRAQRVCGQCSTASPPDASKAWTILRTVEDGKTVYNLTAPAATSEAPSRVALRVGSQSPSGLTGRPSLSGHWLRGSIHRDCSSNTGLKHTIIWERAAIQQAWSAGTSATFQVEVAGDVDLFAEELEVQGSQGAQLMMKPGVALLSLEDGAGCTWQALPMGHS